MTPARARLIGTALLLGGALVAAGSIIPPALFGSGPDAIHSPSVLSSTITVCDRQYRVGTEVRTIADISATDGLPPVLVEPAPLGPCPGRNAHGDQPCHPVDVGACATVVYVRVGDDAYVGYGLVGGP